MMADVASPPHPGLLELDPDATPRKPTRTQGPSASPLKRTSLSSNRTSVCAPLPTLQLAIETPLGSGLPSPSFSFSLPDVNFASGSEISDSETDAESSGVSHIGRAGSVAREQATNGYSSEASTGVEDSEEEDASKPRITFQEGSPRRLRASSIGGTRLRRVPSPSPLAQPVADPLENKWTRSLSLFRRKRSAPDLRSLAREQADASPLPPVPSSNPRNRFSRAFSLGPAPDELSATLAPAAAPPKQLKNKSSMKSLRSRSPFRPQTPTASPPPPTPPPLPLDEDPFAFLPTTVLSASPHPGTASKTGSLGQRRARQSKMSAEARPKLTRQRSHTSPSSPAPPVNILALYIPPETSSFNLALSSPKRPSAPQSSPITPNSDASDGQPPDSHSSDGRGRGRVYGGDRSGSGPPPAGPNQVINASRRPLPPPRKSGGRDDDDEEDDRPPPRRAAVQDVVNDSDSSSSDDSSSDTDSEDFKTPLEVTPDDDDVPLAVAHPATALKAQKSLRLDRRKEKTEERLRKRAERKRTESPPSRRRTGTATSNSTALPQTARKVPKELPSAYGVAGMDGVFRAEELEQKLRDLELRASTTPATAPSSPAMDGGQAFAARSRIGSESHSPAAPLRRKPSALSTATKAGPPLPSPPPIPHLSQAHSLSAQASLSRAKSTSAARPSKSLSRPTRQASASRPQSPTFDPASLPMHRKASEPAVPPPSTIGRQRSMSNLRRPSNPADVPPLPPLPGASLNFPSPSVQPSPGVRSRRPTLNGQGPPPELDRLRTTSNPPRLLSVSLEHADAGRTVRLEIPDALTAGGLLELLKQRGDVPSGRSGENLMKGDLAVWERGDEWNVERPLRDYEVLGQVQAAWNPVKRENTFVVKRCTQCELLTLRAIPNQCPNVIGWVQVYSERKKKWSKRFLEVRNGAVCLAKNERGKEEQHLCTLTAFDFYLVTQVPAKSPKGHFFALKSQDQFAFFENSSDYIHTFVCDGRTFEAMYRGILSARSHSLTTSNPALFSPSTLSPTSATASRGPSASASPVQVDMSSFGGLRRPSASAPLTATSSMNGSGSNGLWQQGSLLSKLSR